MHISRHLWQALDAGVMTPRALRYAILYHGLSCSICEDEFRAYSEGESEYAVWPRDEAWPTTPQAARDVRDLGAMTLDVGLGKIERARTRFRRTATAVALLREVRARKEVDLPAAARFAEFAMAVAQRLPDAAHGPVLRGLAYAEAGDVSRQQGDPQAAAWRLARADSMLGCFWRLGRGSRPAPRDAYVDATLILYRGYLHLDREELLDGFAAVTYAQWLLQLLGRVEESQQAGRRLEQEIADQGQTGTAVDSRVAILLGDLEPWRAWVPFKEEMGEPS